LTRLKTAVSAAMPIVSVSSDAHVNAGLRRSARRPWRTSRARSSIRGAALIAADVHRLGEAEGGRPRASVGGEREVRAQLLLEIGVAPIRAHEVADADDPLAQGGHAAGLMAARRPRGARA